MGRKKILEKRLARLMAKKNGLVARAQASEDVNEVRSINEQLQDINCEIAETQEEIDAIEDEGEGNGNGNPIEGEGEQRNNINFIEQRGGNPIASFSQTSPQTRSNEPAFSSMEYRMAFKSYVQRGTPISQDVITRAAGDEGTTVLAELGMIIPMTIMNEFIKDIQKVYGQVYSKVRKLNIKGGVKFPISALGANFSWITETTVSKKQKAGDIKEYIEFSYNIGEIRVAETLLAQIISLDMFEAEIVRIMVEAYVKTMDEVILAGTGVGQPLGITVDPRVLNNPGHVIEFTATEFAKWDQWRKKLFAVIPLSKRGIGEFLFTAATVEGELLTMKDNNDRPIFKEATELSVGESAITGRFYGRSVTLVEPGTIKDFATAEAGDIVGIYWVPRDYAINTNLAFGMKRYFDEDSNEWINKGLTIVDGKMVDVSGCYIIKKKA